MQEETTHTHEYESNGVAGFLLGLTVGCLVGAAIAILLAPQPGADTRQMLRQAAGELKHRASELKEKASNLAGDVYSGLEELGSRTRKMFRKEAAAEPTQGLDPGGVQVI